MKLVVIQHRMRSSAADDFESLAESVAVACGLGADVIVCPRVPSIQDGPLISRHFLDRVGECADGTTLLVPFAWPAGDAEPPLKFTPLGATALLTGDQALDPQVRRSLYETAPEAVIIRPQSESPLQAEAFIELAIALSESTSAVVVVADPVGPEAEPPSFGGSCVAVLGDLMTEAESEDETELLEVELDAPIILGHARPPVPEPPGILIQRWEHHHGRKPAVDYPADLT